MITPAWFFPPLRSACFLLAKTTASAGVGSACLGLLVAPPAVASPEKTPAKRGAKRRGGKKRESPPRSDSDGRGYFRRNPRRMGSRRSAAGLQSPLSGAFFSLCVVNRLLSVESHRLSQTVHSGSSSSSSQTDTKGSDVGDQRGSTAPQHKKVH